MDSILIRVAISLSYSLSKFTDSLKISFFKALDFLMDSSYFINDYFYDGDDDDHHRFLFFDRNSSTTISDSSEDISNERLYLVHFRWWKEVQEPLFGEISGVSYTLSLWEDFRDVYSASEVVLDLLRVEKSDDDYHVKEMSFSDRKYVVIEEWMFLKALKWHNGIRNTGSSLPREDNSKDLFSLRIRISLLRGTNSLVVKITRKDKDVGIFKKACDILYVESGMLQILDFSEQTAQCFTNDRKLNSDKNQLHEEELEVEMKDTRSAAKNTKALPTSSTAILSETDFVVDDLINSFAKPKANVPKVPKIEGSTVKAEGSKSQKSVGGKLKKKFDVVEVDPDSPYEAELVKQAVDILNTLKAEVELWKGKEQEAIVEEGHQKAKKLDEALKCKEKALKASEKALEAKKDEFKNLEKENQMLVGQLLESEKSHNANLEIAISSMKKEMAKIALKAKIQTIEEKEQGKDAKWDLAAQKALLEGFDEEVGVVNSKEQVEQVGDNQESKEGGDQVDMAGKAT